MKPYGIMGVINIGSSNWLLPDGTKPLPEPMLILCQLDLRKTPVKFESKYQLPSSL